MTRAWKFILSLLALVALTVWLAVFSSPGSQLRLIACDVGEGDAILVTYKNTQILTDGGPNNKVIDCLSRHLPFWDREIELVVLTHPDADHYRGLIEVFKRYKVDNFLYNDLDISGSDYQVLEKEVGGGGIRLLHPREGMHIRSGLIQLDILSPKETDKNQGTNENSIVDLLTFRDFKALLTGDMTPATSERLAANWLFGTVDYIKIPHHGSKNGITEKLLDVVRPKLAVISVGKNNYGHPDNGVLKILEDRNIKILRTDEKGDVEVLTDGSSWKNN